MKKLKLIATVFIVLAWLLVLVAPFTVNAAGETLMSYQDENRMVPWGYYSGAAFNSTYYIAYMKGENFTPDTNAYKVAYYDGSDAHVEVALDSGLTVDSDGILESQYALNTNTSASEGVWHSVAYPIDGSVANPYDSSDPDIIVDIGFWVNASAIPEFPTVITMIAAMGLSFGIYYWMRKRYYRQGVAA